MKILKKSFSESADTKSEESTASGPDHFVIDTRGDRKRKSEDDGEEDTSTNDSAGTGTGNRQPRQKKPKIQYRGFREDPFRFFDQLGEDPVIKEIQEHFQLKVWERKWRLDTLR